MGHPHHDHNSTGLGSRALLDKIDKLRELGISATIPLPQIVAAGEQSAGKSSLLESLTGISFPRAVSLCTRFATEIICRREAETSIVITIQPDHGCLPAHAEAVRAFRRTVDSFTGEAFTTVFKEAAAAMGIRTDDDSRSSAPTFTRDVLRIEKNGPDEEHLTLIDVPGIFENETPGVTTKGDITLVKEMVMSYIKDSRTIILAVVPCNTDVATQAIIRLARDVDPEGKRTLGVLTKPDLAVEVATKNAVVDLVRGKRRDIQLGYCIVRNRGADDHSSIVDMASRDSAERTFFSCPPWNTLDPDRVGILALRSRLQLLLLDRSRAEFPSVKRDLGERLNEATKILGSMGESRSTRDEQVGYLLNIKNRFDQLVNYGVNAYYTGDPLFTEKEDLRLITHIRELNETFSRVFFRCGHHVQFDSGDPEAAKEIIQEAEAQLPTSETWETSSICSSDEQVKIEAVTIKTGRFHPLYLHPLSFRIPALDDDDLDGILQAPAFSVHPLSRPLLRDIAKMHLKYRGNELGTFGSAIIPAMFKEQAQKWQSLTLSHVSNTILVVHNFIMEVLKEACPDALVREALLPFLREELVPCYRRAIDRALFLLDVELNGAAVTVNPAFDRAINKARRNRIAQAAEQDAVDIPAAVRGVTEGRYINVEQLSKQTKNDQGCEIILRIHDVTKSYYEVARTRFVDNICTQAVHHSLLAAKDGPLQVLSSDFIMKQLTPEDLELVAGEDVASRHKRAELKQRIKMLEKGVKILRG